MSDVNNEDQDYVSTKLLISPHIPISNETHAYYKEQHRNLSKMKRNQLSIIGVDINKDQEDQIVVTSFLRSTVEKAIQLKKATIVLLDKNSEPFAKVAVDFTKI